MLTSKYSNLKKSNTCGAIYMVESMPKYIFFFSPSHLLVLLGRLVQKVTFLQDLAMSLVAICNITLA